MKPWPLFIGIIVILTIFCSPGLAISKSDLLFQYAHGYLPTPTPVPTPFPHYDPGIYDPGTSYLPDLPHPTPTPTVIPTPVPTQAPPIWASPVVPDSYSQSKSSFLDSLSGYFTKKSESPSETMTFKDNTAFSMKPNIYLYSNHDFIAQVRLAPENAITISEPVYQPGKGWLAQIHDGSLNGNGDFLFYESVVPDSVWQKEEGYVICAAYREQDMASLLGQYGFNEKETVDFIEYWASHLVGDVDYVFYPQETDAVNEVMPLSVSPKPDHVMRIWFYAEPLVSAPEPVTSPERIVREGFYVVEWGVIINGQYWINHSPASSEVVQ